MRPTVFVLLSPAALLGVVLAQAPGDQDQAVCLPAYEYPVNVTVLMDSWKYRKNLLPPGSANHPTVWDRISLDDSKTLGIWVYKGLACEDSRVEVCSLMQEYQNNWLFTQYINKSVPANDFYPVRVFVNITYSFMTCPGIGGCSPQFKLLKYITNSQKHRSVYTNTSLYSEDGIMPDNIITNTSDNGTKHFYFDMSEEDKGFYLALQDYSEDKGTCVSVSRVLVYRHECHDFTEGRVHFPAVQAPVSGTVLVRSECIESAHHRTASRLQCTSEGQWRSDQIVCECDFGYYMSDNKCRAYITPMTMSYMVTEEQQFLDVCYTSTSQTPLTVDVQTRDNTAIANFDYVSVNKSLTFGLSSNHQCVKIHVATDALQEKEESFVIDIIGPGGINISHTEVLISPSNTDNSCENGTLTLSSGMDGSSFQLVEMCSEGVWSPVCDHNWTLADATVVCRELGYHYLGLAEVLESGATPHHTQMVPECEGTESSLTDCLELFDGVMTCQYVLVECRNDTSVVTITTSLHSPEPTITLPSVDASDSVHVGTIAGVAGSVALMAILVLLVLLVIVILHKRRKDKEPRGGYLDNPIYSVAEGLENQLDGQDTGNPTPDKVVEKLKETSSSHAFENPIYDCAESSTNSPAANADQPQYSTLEESVVPAEYEVPLILSPTAENNHHPHIYDSATAPDPPTGADDSVLEQVNHIYSCLEGPDLSVASSGKGIGQGKPTDAEGSQLQEAYSFIEPK